MLDDRSRSILLGREMHPDLPLSIASGIALESALGQLAEAKDPHPPVLDHDVLLTHQRTLYRNLVGSVKTADERKQLTPVTIAEALATEMRVFEAMVSEISEGRCQVEFYHCNYSSVMSKFSRALLKLPNTPGQKQAVALEHMTYKTFADDVSGKPPVHHWDMKFPDFGVRGLLLTHYPIDLLQRYRFRSLNLLESHTGAIKPPSLWNTKLKGGWDLEQIPFDRMTLQMFGDGTHFLSMPKKIRMTLFNIAVKNKWTHASTKDFIIYCVTKHRDPALEVLVKEMYRI